MQDFWASGGIEETKQIQEKVMFFQIISIASGNS